MRTAGVSRAHALPRKDVDCSDCPAGRRCWGEPVPAQSGFVVRREAARNAGELVFAQGDPFTAVYLVSGGCVKIVETGFDGTDRVVGFRVPGEMMGLEGMTGGRHAHRAEALAETTVCRLQWTPGRELPAQPQLLQRLLLKVVKQCGAGQGPWSGLPAVERVGEFLADFAARLKRDDAFPLPMTRAELGSYLGLAEETVVRAIGRLKSTG